MQVSPSSSQEVNRHSSFVIFIASVAALAGILFGFDTGVISGAILFVADQFKLTPGMNGLVVSSVLFGALLGSLVSGRFADYFGRRNLLLIVAWVFIIGTLISALANSVACLILGRIIVGVAIGTSSYIAPLYISEISPPRLRGALVSFNQLAVTIGIVVSYLVDYGFAAHPQGWRWMFGTGVIPAVILFVFMVFLPESPRWAVLKGYVDRARATLQKIRSSNEVEQELMEIKDSLRQQQGDWRMLFQRWLLPVLIIGFGLGFFQQFTGINTIIYYAPTIFKLAGFQSSATAILATLGVGLVNVLFTIVALPLLDRWGRRPLLLTGIAAMIVSLGTLGFAFYSGFDVEGLKWFAFGSIILFIAGFAIGLGPVMWLMFAEIFPLRIRGLGTSVVTSAQWGFNMIVSLTFLTLVQLLGAHGTFFLYAGLSVLAWLFVYFMVPETKDCSLEHIEANLRSGKPARQLGLPINK